MSRVLPVEVEKGVLERKIPGGGRAPFHLLPHQSGRRRQDFGREESCLGSASVEQLLRCTFRWVHCKNSGWRQISASSRCFCWGPPSSKSAWKRILIFTKCTSTYPKEKRKKGMRYTRKERTGVWQEMVLTPRNFLVSGGPGWSSTPSKIVRISLSHNEVKSQTNFTLKARDRIHAPLKIDIFQPDFWLHEGRKNWLCKQISPSLSSWFQDGPPERTSLKHSNEWTPVASSTRVSTLTSVLVWELWPYQLVAVCWVTPFCISQQKKYPFCKVWNKEISWAHLELRCGVIATNVPFS